jgi:hypothetical protein
LQHAAITEQIQERLRLVLAGERPEPRAATARENYPIQIHIILLPRVPKPNPYRTHHNGKSRAGVTRMMRYART